MITPQEKDVLIRNVDRGRTAGGGKWREGRKDARRRGSWSKSRIKWRQGRGY